MKKRAEVVSLGDVAGLSKIIVKPILVVVFNQRIRERAILLSFCNANIPKYYRVFIQGLFVKILVLKLNLKAPGQSFLRERGKRSSHNQKVLLSLVIRQR